MTINRMLIFSIIIDILKNIQSSTKCSIMKWSYSKYILRVFFNNVFLYKFNDFFAPSISDNAALCSGVFPCSFLGFISSTFSLMRRKASKLPFLAAWWSGVFPSFLWFKIQSYKKLSVTKKCTPKLIFLNEKKKDSDGFWLRKLNLKVLFGLFWPSLLKWAKGLELFYGPFHRPLALLIHH